MSVQVKRRREAATFLAGFTGAQGELIVDTTNNRVQVHDGATAGGFPAAKLSEVLQGANNLLDVPNKPAALANLGAVATAQIGVASGVASLDSTGHVPLAQLPAVAAAGALQYQGTWNAATNTPALASGTGAKGYFYKVSVAGTTSIDGNAQWSPGDMILFDGTVWDKIDGPSPEVVSVAGLTGSVTAAQILSAIEANTGASGSGALVFSSSPAFVTPNLGTPSSVNLVNATSLPASALPAFTGDVTSPAGSSVNTLASVNPSSGTVGSATAIPVLTTNAKGLVTAQTTAAIAAPAGTLTGSTLAANVTASSLTSVGSLTSGSIPTSLLAGTLQAAQEPAHTGDVTNAAGNLAMTVGSIGGKAVSLGGAFSMSGAYSFMGTLTANTALTFPVSGTVTALGNAATGTGAIVLGTSPTLTTPNLGTPSAINLANASALAAAALPAFTGDVTSPAGSTVNTLATVNSAPGTLGSSTAIPVLTTNGKGLVTSQTTATVVAPAGTLTGTTLASNVTASSLTSVGALTAGTIPTALLSGVTAAAHEPAHTGDVTNPAGSLAMSVVAIGGVAPGPAATALAGQIPATSANDSANAGNIGEYLLGQILSTSPVSLTSGTITSLASITLTPGDWDIWTTVYFIAASGTSVTYSSGGFSGTTATLNLTSVNGAFALPVAYTGNGTALMGFSSPIRRTSTGLTAPAYVNAQCNFSGGTCTAYGSIQARRAR